MHTRTHTRSHPLWPNRYSWLVYVFSEKHTHLLSHIQTHNKLFFMDVVCVCVLVHCAQTILAVWVYMVLIRFDSGFGWCSELFVYTSLHYYYTILSMTILYDSQLRDMLFSLPTFHLFYICICVCCILCGTHFLFLFIRFVRRGRVCDKRQACTS